MKKNIFLGIILVGLMGSCTSTKKGTTISSGVGQHVGQSALVYGLPQTRLYFDVEMVKTIIKKGPYAEYANRMLGLQNVPMKDSESWQIRSIRINDRQEMDNKQLYTLSFINYPQNVDKLLRFTKEGLLMDLASSNVLVNSQYSGKSGEEFQFVNAAVRSTTTEKVDTTFRTILTDTAFVKIPVLQRKVMSKTAEEQAREAAQQIFNIRQSRLDMLTGNTDYHPEGAALKLVLQSLDTQEEQLLSLFNGAKIESRIINTYSAVPDKAGATPLFYFSDRAGAVNKNTAGAKEVWFEVGKTTAPVSITPSQEAVNTIYYRIPQVTAVSAGVDKNVMVNEQITIYQFGNLVSFPLVAPKK